MFWMGQKRLTFKEIAEKSAYQIELSDGENHVEIEKVFYRQTADGRPCS